MSDQFVTTKGGLSDMSTRLRGTYRFTATAAGVLALFALPAMANTIPNGGTDGLCTPQAVGPTTCTVFEGTGDTLTEEFLNLTRDPILVDNITAGGISYLSGDITDVITSDPVSDINCIGATLNPGQSCLFNQSFGTGPEPGPVPPVDMGMSSMSFNILFTNLVGADFPNAFVAPCPASLQVNGLAPCITLLDRGADPARPPGELYGLNITSAIVTVKDVVPEPATILLFGTGLAALGVAFRRLRH
jgi:PEP-CTERM motif